MLLGVYVFIPETFFGTHCALSCIGIHSRTVYFIWTITPGAIIVTSTEFSWADFALCHIHFCLFLDVSVSIWFHFIIFVLIDLCRMIFDMLDILKDFDLVLNHELCISLLLKCFLLDSFSTFKDFPCVIKFASWSFILGLQKSLERYETFFTFLPVTIC